MNPYLDRQTTIQHNNGPPEGSIMNDSKVEDLSPIHSYKSRTGNDFFPNNIA